jgi:small subunit ribosomal protein S8
MGMIQDPISDMLTRIRNAAAVGKPEVVLPYSKMKHQVANLLHREGYVGNVTKVEPGNTETDANASRFAALRVGLKYDENRKPAFRELKRVSKPGLRIYRGKERLPVVLNNMGVAIISTSQGLMTNLEAKKLGVGGEVICEVY